MRYEKPEVIALASAMGAIQNLRCPKGHGNPDSSACQSSGPLTPGTYTADE